MENRVLLAVQKSKIMENKVLLTEKALEEITLAKHEAMRGDRHMTYYHLGRLDAFLYLLGYPTELNQPFYDILTLLSENEKI